jgi:hypothetical protein
MTLKIHEAVKYLGVGLLSFREGRLPSSFVQMGDVGFEIYGPVPQLSVGRHSYGRVRVFNWAKSSRLIIRNFTSIAHLTVLLGGGHHMDVSTYPFRSKFLGIREDAELSKGGVTIGNDVWIGENVFVRDNTKIGDGAVLGLGALVTGNVPPYAIVGGNPAQIIKYRFSEDEIKALQELAWWNLPEPVIRDHLDVFYSNDVKSFRSALTSQTGAPRQSADHKDNDSS